MAPCNLFICLHPICLCGAQAHWQQQIAVFVVPQPISAQQATFLSQRDHLLLPGSHREGTVFQVYIIISNIKVVQKLASLSFFVGQGEL